MTKSTSRKKRNKLTRILLLPIFAPIFLVGWSLYWIGQPGQPKAKQPQKPINKTPAKQDAFELIMIPQQEKEILTN
jgi:hypothetical protein